LAKPPQGFVDDDVLGSATPSSDDGPSGSKRFHENATECLRGARKHEYRGLLPKNSSDLLTGLIASELYPRLDPKRLGLRTEPWFLASSSHKKQTDVRSSAEKPSERVQ
jgi:hypothetical protein